MLRLAYRIAHYPGTIRNLALAERRASKPAPARTAAPPADDATWIPSTPAAVAHSPLARYISFGGGQDV